MKIIKYILLLFILFLFFFVVLGLLKPEVKYGHEITVNKPIQESWDTFQDPSKMDQWLKGFKSIDLIEGTQDEIGSKYKVVVKPSEGEPDFEMIETLVDKKDLEFVELNFDSDMMVFDQTTSFKQKGNQTTIKTESSVKGKGLMMRSMFAAMDMFTGSFQSQEEENLNNLKDLINNQ